MLPVLLAAVIGGTARGQSTFDPARLPAADGRVAFLVLAPRGEVNGLILADGTEVILPPRLAARLAGVVAPGDAVTVHGLRARAIPMIQAASVTNRANGRTVADAPPTDGSPEAGPPPPPEAMPPAPGDRAREAWVSGTVRNRLHGGRGELNGVLLEDGTTVRLSPGEAARFAARLRPGTPIAAQGSVLSNRFGRVVEARRIGPDPDPAAVPPYAAPPGPGGRR